MGIGTPARVNGLQESFGSATRALSVASALRLKGVHSEETLGLASAVVSAGDVGARMVARYLAPLDALGSFGSELERTIEAFLSHNLRVDQTAAALFLHRSTLKYRLRRYQELTGMELKDVNHIVGLWWALQRRRVDRPTCLKDESDFEARQQALHTNR